MDFCKRTITDNYDIQRQWQPPKIEAHKNWNEVSLGTEKEK